MVTILSFRAPLQGLGRQVVTILRAPLTIVFWTNVHPEKWLPWHLSTWTNAYCLPWQMKPDLEYSPMSPYLSQSLVCPNWWPGSLSANHLHYCQSPLLLVISSPRQLSGPDLSCWLSILPYMWCFFPLCTSKVNNRRFLDSVDNFLDTSLVIWWWPKLRRDGNQDFFIMN